MDIDDNTNNTIAELAAIQNTARTLFEQSRKIRKLEAKARNVVSEYHANQNGDENSLTAAMQELETLIASD